jgi:hypothetical protein
VTRWLSREIPAPGLVLVLVGLAVLGAALAQLALRRAWPRLVDGEHNEVAGFLIAVVGVIYAVLVGFVLIGVWERYEDARHGVEAEAAALGDLVADAAVMGDEHGAAVAASVASYTNELATVEWPAMAEGGRSDRATDLLQDLRLAIFTMEPSTSGEALAVESQLDAIRSAADLRNERLNGNTSGLPGALWLVLVAAGLVAAGFATLFGLRDRAVHFVMVGSTAAMIALTVAVVMLLNFPFAGDLSIGPEALDRLRESADS